MIEIILLLLFMFKSIACFVCFSGYGTAGSKAAKYGKIHSDSVAWTNDLHYKTF